MIDNALIKDFMKRPSIEDILGMECMKEKIRAFNYSEVMSETLKIKKVPKVVRKK
jgi:hypothetical protein